MNPETTKIVFICYGFFALSAVLLAIPGVVWANRAKVIVYDGKADLILACVTLPIVVVSLAELSFEDWFSWLLHLTGFVLLSYSVWLSYKANESIGKTIVVVPTKFVLVGLIAFCALLALEGIVGGIKAQRKRDYEDATAKYLTGAIGAFGVYHLHKLISKFVRGNAVEAKYGPPIQKSF